MSPSSMNMWEDFGKLILRLTVAVLLVFHGIAKIQNGIAWMAEPLRAFGLPLVVGYGVYVAEVVAPILLILGILTRPAALIVAFDLVMALVLVHQGQTFQISPRSGGLNGELELFYIFAALAIALLGSGRFAVSRGQGPLD